MVRSIASVIIGCLATMTIFGIVLSLLWFVGSEGISFKLISALISAVLAVAI